MSSSGIPSNEPSDTTPGSQDSEHHGPGPPGSKINGTKHSTNAFGQPDGGEAGKTSSRATRIGASASGLINDVLGSSSANGFMSGLTSGMTDGSKGQSSSSSSGPSESSTAVQNLKSRPDAGIGSSRSPMNPESFRSSPTDTRSFKTNAQSDFDNFMSNGDGSLVADNGMNGIYYGQRTIHNERGQLSETASNTLTRDDQLPIIGTHSPLPESHRGDGAAVVSLLSDPEFSTDDPSAYSDPYDHDVMGNDGILARLTSQELDLLTRIKKELPEPPIHRVPAPTNPLNLLPNFEQLSGDTNGKFGSSATTTPRTEEPYLYLTPETTGTWSIGENSGGKSSEAEEAHLSQWLNVLNRYQDEVWGDILPLVREARKEIERAKNSNADELRDGPAVRRLAMVLAHLTAGPASTKASPIP